jgi:hypothetical protein
MSFVNKTKYSIHKENMGKYQFKKFIISELYLLHKCPEEHRF